MEFKKYKLGEIGDVVTGKTPSTLDESNFGGNIPFITPSDITNNAFMLKKAGRTISIKGFETIKANTISGPSVLVGCIGSDMGNVGFVDMKCATNQQINSITNIKDFCNPVYLYYRLSQMKDIFQKMSNSTTTPILSKSEFEKISITLPSLSIQQNIASTLSSLDRKIALNLAINQNLEALAKQLYDYWFVQFDFPNEEGKPYKSSGGAMVWNEKLKREIPEGWNNGTVGDLFATQAGYAFKSSEWKECGHPVLTIKNIQEDGSVTFSDASFIDKYDCKLDKYSSNNGNMIFAMSGNTIGKIGIISSNIPNVLINQRVLIIKTNVKNIAFPYFVIKDKKIQNLVLQLGANSAQPNISEEEFRNIKICKPPKSIMDDFNQMFKDSFEKIINNRIEIDVLTKQRDELLPLLMNGQVTIE